MRRLIFGMMFGAILVTVTAAIGDDKEQAIKNDRKQIQGTWRVNSLIVNGDRAAGEDTMKLTVVNGDDGSWSLRLEGKEISAGTSTIDPTKTPKTIDFMPTVGAGNGERHHGIYELGDNERTLCFAPAGMNRPTEFSSTPENKYYLVTFARVKDD